MTELLSLLAIETATSNCSVALSHAGKIFERAENGSNVHSQVLLTMVREVLDDADVAISELHAIAVGQGPGSFTGLRIGVGVAQGLAYGCGCQMIGISSLEVLAHQAPMDGSVIAAIDARMGEVYWCEFIKSGHSLARQSALMVTPPEQMLTTLQSPKHNSVQLLGNAWSEYSERFSQDFRDAVTPVAEQLYPSATSLLTLAKDAYSRGQTISPVDFAPEYVRNDVAKKSAAQVAKKR